MQITVSRNVSIVFYFKGMTHLPAPINSQVDKWLPLNLFESCQYVSHPGAVVYIISRSAIVRYPSQSLVCSTISFSHPTTHTSILFTSSIDLDIILYPNFEMDLFDIRTTLSIQDIDAHIKGCARIKSLVCKYSM